MIVMDELYCRSGKWLGILEKRQPEKLHPIRNSRDLHPQPIALQVTTLQGFFLIGVAPERYSYIPKLGASTYGVFGPRNSLIWGGSLHREDILQFLEYDLIFYSHYSHVE